jgi:hypothetical protein
MSVATSLYQEIILDIDAMKAFFLLFLVGLQGCTNMRFDYYFISFEKIEGAEILERKLIGLPNLKNNSAIPVRYLITRDNYDLFIEITDKSYSPHAKVSVKDGKYFVVPKRDTSAVSDTGKICSSYYLDAKDKSTLSFGWSIECLSDEVEKAIIFDVVDASGALVSSERMRFQIKQNGEYILRDAL